MVKKIEISSREVEVGLCTDETVLLSEYAKRKLDHVFVSVRNDDVSSKLDEGWIPYKVGKLKSRLSQPKGIQHH